MSSKLLLPILVLTCTYCHPVKAGWHSRQTADFNEGGLPSHLPAPPEPADVGANGQPLSEMKQQGGPEPPPPAQPTPAPQASPSGPLGLSGAILILVPEFKFTIYRFPAWFGASVKLSFPITFFFDQLGFRPDAPDLPFPFGPWVPPSVKRRFSQHMRKRTRQRTSTNSRYSGRYKREAPILSLPPPSSMRGGERALIFPRLENLLKSAGISSGRECLLRTVCEVHETSLKEGYGLLGDMITLLFSISRSSYADSHLPEYLSAEESGKSGNCSRYYSNCKHSIFESIEKKEHENQQCEVVDGDSFCE